MPDNSAAAHGAGDYLDQLARFVGLTPEEDIPEAVLARSDSASAGVICGRSISARSGSPSADCTVMVPNVRALATGEYRPAHAMSADASAQYLQRGREEAARLL